MNNENLTALKLIARKQKRGIAELENIFSTEKNYTKKEKEMITLQAKEIQSLLRKTNDRIPEVLEKISLMKPLKKETLPQASIKTEAKKPELKKQEKIPFLKTGTAKIIKLTPLEKLTIKRINKKEKEEVVEKIREPSKYIAIANGFFSETSRKLLEKSTFKTIEKDLTKANIDIAPVSYVSIMLFTTAIAAGAGFLLFLFLLLFNLSEFPIISFISESVGIRFLKVFWIMLVVPIGTFIAMYVYPSMEKSSNENKINQELPFATIHMATISGSMVEPSRIFSIIISTKEYPYLEKEFRKLLNYINIYGYDLVTALRNVASNTSSRKLTDLFNGLATTINSGGDLPDFFNKRAQSLLFDYRLEREKYIKFSETFMDIYISAVIAAPMILMLLLMMMKISGLGISLSSSMISLIMVLGVAGINIVFLVFLHLRQPTE